MVVHEEDLETAATVAHMNGGKLMDISGNGANHNNNNSNGIVGNCTDIISNQITTITSAADLMRSTECLSLVSKDCLLQGGADDFTFDLDLDMSDQQDALGFYDDWDQFFPDEWAVSFWQWQGYS